MVDLIRTFIAVDLPEEVKEGLKEIIEKYRGLNGANWIKAEGAHITIKFIGEIGRDVVEGLAFEVENIVKGINPFNVRLEGMGVFPSISKPRVLWVGVRDEKFQLRNLHHMIDEEVRKVGIKREEKNYLPHLTIARMKGTEEKDIKPILEEYNNKRLWEFQAKYITIFKSTLHPDGAIYQKLYEFPLGGNKK